MNRIDRRRFMAGTLAGTWLLGRAGSVPAAKRPQAGPTLDAHVHLIGTGDGRSGCILSKQITDLLRFKLLVKSLRIRRRGRTLDEEYVRVLVEHLRGCPLDRAAVFAQDAVYDHRGRFDRQRTQFYVPNDYLFRITGRYPQWMVPCVGINPDRADCIDELERCVDKGARMLKIYPPMQGVDLAAKKHTRFFRRCAELNVVVAVHTGFSHAIPVAVLNNHLSHPRKLEAALEQGCTVLACHSATCWPRDGVDMIPDFLAMLRKYPNLWGDTAAVATVGRSRDFLRLLADEVAPDRFIHGSDFPFVCRPLAFRRQIGLGNALRVRRIPNRITRSLALKNRLGIGQASAQRAFRMLAGPARQASVSTVPRHNT